MHGPKRPVVARPTPGRHHSKAALDPAGEALFERLRALRKRLAEAGGVPAYVVFPDSALREMARARPTDEQGLLAVPGVGPAKLERYGAEFLGVLGSDAESPDDG